MNLPEAKLNIYDRLILNMKIFINQVMYYSIKNANTL